MGGSSDFFKAMTRMFGYCQLSETPSLTIRWNFVKEKRYSFLFSYSQFHESRASRDGEVMEGFIIAHAQGL